MSLYGLIILKFNVLSEIELCMVFEWKENIGWQAKD